MTLIERMAKLAWRLDMEEGRYTDCDIVLMALDRINRLEKQLAREKRFRERFVAGRGVTKLVTNRATGDNKQTGETP